MLDLPGRIPLPAKIIVRALPNRSTCRRSSARSPDPDDAYELVTGTMQDALDELDDERTIPIVG